MLDVRLNDRYLPSKTRQPSGRTGSPTRRFPAVVHALAWLLFLCYASLLANAQAFLRNGQFFTKALAISNAPFPGRYVVQYCIDLLWQSDVVPIVHNMPEATW